MKTLEVTQELLVCCRRSEGTHIAILTMFGKGASADESEEGFGHAE